jgi:4a-hydroxytetrahydrobiopterin dehydratase
MSQPLAPEQLSSLLTERPGWEVVNGALCKQFTFADFESAMAFMVRAAPAIEAIQHHPEWTNIYSRVAVRLTTHEAGDQLTALDIKLAKILDVQAAWTDAAEQGSAVIQDTRAL